MLRVLRSTYNETSKKKSLYIGLNGKIQRLLRRCCAQNLQLLRTSLAPNHHHSPPIYGLSATIHTANQRENHHHPHHHHHHRHQWTLTPRGHVPPLKRSPPVRHRFLAIRPTLQQHRQHQRFIIGVA